jgi:WhiB family redox-sensing transcriptional regulator
MESSTSRPRPSSRTRVDRLSSVTGSLSLPSESQSGQPLLRPARRWKQANYWWDAAACRLSDPELFFPVSSAGPSVKQTDKAKECCARCLVRRQCLDFALSSNQVHGVWGGLTEQERHRMQVEALPTAPPVPGQADLKRVR